MQTTNRGFFVVTVQFRSVSTCDVYRVARRLERRATGALRVRQDEGGLVASYLFAAEERPDDIDARARRLADAVNCRNATEVRVAWRREGVPAGKSTSGVFHAA